jgi:ferredoxin
VYRIEIDHSLCSGFGSCAQFAPKSIRIGADGLAVATDTQTDDAVVVEAAASCPMGAIVAWDEGGAQAA